MLMKEILENDFDIAGLTSEEVEDIVFEKAKENPFWDKYIAKNHVSYIVIFFAEVLSDGNGRFAENTKYSDLHNVYLIDYKLKQVLLETAHTVEKFLDVAMMRSGIRNGDVNNNLSKKITNLSNGDANRVISYYSKYHSAIDETNFTASLNAAERLKSFCEHHYSLSSYSYAALIKNGERHKEKDGLPEIRFSKDWESVLKLLSPEEINVVVNNIQFILKNASLCAKAKQWYEAALRR